MPFRAALGRQQGGAQHPNTPFIDRQSKKDESPEEGANPYWSDELLAVLAEALGDEDRARQTLAGIIQQAQEGKAMQTLSTEGLAPHLTELYGRRQMLMEGTGRLPGQNN